MESAKKGDVLKKTLVRHVPFSSILLDHALFKLGFPSNTQVLKIYFLIYIFQIGVHVPISKEGAERILDALKLAEIISKEIVKNPTNGFISFTTTNLESGKILECYQVK